MFKEIEFKYTANIPITEFNVICKSLDRSTYFTTTGQDDFYGNKQSPLSFFRHRHGENTNQLTFKKKINENNYIRTEHNFDLSKNSTSTQISEFCKDLGYKFNFSLIKYTSVYCFDYYLLAYYICYDLNMNELGRFIEIEIKEDYKWRNQEEAWNALLILEKTHKNLGISSSNRVKKSLYEMFKGEVAE